MVSGARGTPVALQARVQTTGWRRGALRDATKGAAEPPVATARGVGARGDEAWYVGPVLRLADAVFPGRLWGHSVRGLVLNPVFALLPLLYLDRFGSATWVPVEAFWLTAFLLGFPHAGYTALEIRHYFDRFDGVADRRTLAQLLFFSSYLVFGAVLAGAYVELGARALGARLGGPVPGFALLLAVLGSVGAAMGLQDVLVMDIVLRPARVLRVLASTLFRWRWLRVALLWTAVQLLIAQLVALFA